jgi:hypothetical protein
LKTLDYNDGSVMVLGFEQLATPGGSFDLRAQVRDSATGTYTYSWSTSGLTSSNTISGTSKYDLTFDWNTTISTASAESVTLTVTDPNLPCWQRSAAIIRTRPALARCPGRMPRRSRGVGTT